MRIWEREGGEEWVDRTGWFLRSWASRVVGRGCSVEMYMVGRARPWGGGSWDERSRVRRSWVLPAPLDERHKLSVQRATTKRGGFKEVLRVPFACDLGDVSSRDPSSQGFVQRIIQGTYSAPLANNLLP